VFLLLSIASFYWCELVIFDIEGAFLNAEFEEVDATIYIKISKEVAEEWKVLERY